MQEKMDHLCHVKLVPISCSIPIQQNDALESENSMHILLAAVLLMNKIHQQNIITKTWINLIIQLHNLSMDVTYTLF